jgi:hypothetical protein
MRHLEGSHFKTCLTARYVLVIAGKAQSGVKQAAPANSSARGLSRRLRKIKIEPTAGQNHALASFREPPV